LNRTPAHAQRPNEASDVKASVRSGLNRPLIPVVMIRPSLREIESRTVFVLRTCRRRVANNVAGLNDHFMTVRSDPSFGVNLRCCIVPSMNRFVPLSYVTALSAIEP